MPITALKIDRSFINEMANSDDNMMVTSTIVKLAHALKLRVVAEGVETEEQRDILKFLKYDALHELLIGVDGIKKDIQEHAPSSSPRRIPGSRLLHTSYSWFPAYAGMTRRRFSPENRRTVPLVMSSSEKSSKIHATA